MGDYNPNAPVVLGNEFVGIRDARYVPDSVLERGYVTYIEHTVNAISGGFNVVEIPPTTLQNTVDFISVYRRHTALNSGEVKRIVIPCEALAVTGSKIVATPNNETAVTNPNDLNYVSWLSNAVSGTDMVGFSFDVNTYLTDLINRRLLSVRLIYTAAGDPAELANIITLIVRKANAAQGFNYQTGLEGATDLTLNTGYSYVDFGEYNPMWTAGADQLNGNAIYPWRGTELNLLDSTSSAIANRLIVMMTGNTSDVFNQPRVGYVALEVLYCEETRIAYGGRRSIASGFPINFPSVGDNYVQLRDSSQLLAGITLPPDDYIITLVHKPVGSYVAAQHPPTYGALRELNELGSLRTIELTQPSEIDDVLTYADTPIAVPITLINAGGNAVTGTHDYNEQYRADIVDATPPPSQTIATRSSVGSSHDYWWVRFYARRFPETTTELVITETTITSSAATARISVADFDALPEIIDGWREVTLRLSQAVPIVGGTGTGGGTWQWSAEGENIGSQWQVLGERVADVNGEPTTTYDPPFGSTPIRYTNASGGQSDIDAVISISQDAPIVSGFTITQGILPVTGIGVECGVPNDCIPTGIGYNWLTWTPLAGCDSFDNRTLTDEWGSMETGQDYTLEGGTVPGNYDVADGVGTHTQTSLGATRRSVVASSSPDNYVSGRVRVRQIPTGGSLLFRLSPRYTDGSNYYYLEMFFTASGTVTLRLGKIIAGATTVLTATFNIGTYSPLQWWDFAVRMSGTQLEAKIWPTGSQLVPTTWHVSVDDASLATGSNVAFISATEGTVSTTLPIMMDFDDLYFAPVAIAGGSLQVDRMDEEDDTWQTVIDTENFCITGAYDLEARVGVQNWYRARYLNAGDFAGPWVSGTGTIPSPGVYGVSDANSVLIFSSNRDPLASLAYVMVWDDRPVETFAFPEVDTQVLQRMYNRDFQVAFRPLERGGEAFDRTLLVHAAAIPLESLANFKSLRDLAWADLPYVAVRDELGNRWYANVLVPSGLVRRNRRLYLAQIRVTEVTDTPAPIE